MGIYEELVSAGYSQEEISAEMKKNQALRRRFLTEAGYSEMEINQFELSDKRLESAAIIEQSDDIKTMAQISVPEGKDGISFKRLLELGYQNSVTGMLERGKLPDELTEEERASLNFFDRTVVGLSSIVPDLPIFFAGGKIGAAAGAAAGSVLPGPGTAGGAALGSSIGAFGFHSMSRQILMDMYTRGEVATFEELVYRTETAALEFLKGGFVGAATHGAGLAGKSVASVAAKTAASAGRGVVSSSVLKATSASAPLASEVLGLTTASSFIDGHVPTAQDFVDSALLLGAMKGFNKIGDYGYNRVKNKILPKLKEKFVLEGKSPEASIKEAMLYPEKMQELLGIESIKKGYERTLQDPFGGVPTEEYARFLQNYIIQKGAAIKNKNGDIVVKGNKLRRQKGTGQNYGFVKAIFKHGMKIEDMIKLPEIIREYKPSSTTVRDASIGKIMEEYRVPANEENNYRIAFRREGKERYLITMYLEPKQEGQVYSIKKERSVPAKSSMPKAGYASGDSYTFVPDGERYNSNIVLNRGSVNADKPVLPDGLLSAEDAVKVSAAISKLKKKAGVPVRMGKIRGRKSVQGQYYPKEEMIRLRMPNDIRTLSHEIGHHLEKIVFGGLGSKESLLFKNELNKIASTPRKKTEKALAAEGFAEFVADYVVNPALAKEAAPKFYQYFEKKMSSDAPGSFQMLQDAQETMRMWREQPSAMEVLSAVSVNESGAKMTTSEKVEKMKNDFIVNWLDDAYMLARASEKLGVEKLADESPYFRARMLRGLINDMTESFLHEGQFNFKSAKIPGKSLTQIWKSVKNLDEFRAFLTAERALELSERNIETGIRKQAAQETADALRPKYEAAAKELYEYQDNLLKYAVDAGIIKAETYKSIKEKNNKYVPFARVMDRESSYSLSAKKIKPKTPLKTIKGSTRDIIDPLESILKNTFEIIGNAEKNRVALAVADLAKIDKSGEFVFKVRKNAEPVKTASDQQIVKIDKDGNYQLVEEAWRLTDKINEKNQIVAYRNGKAEVYEVSEDIASFINNLNPIDANFFIETLGAFTKTLRVGATTLSPAFAAKNMIRDQLLAHLSTKGGYNITQLPGVIWSMLKNDEFYQAFKRSGAGMSSAVTFDRKGLQEAMRLLDGTGYTDRVWNSIKGKEFGRAVNEALIQPVYRGLSVTGEVSEKITRFGEFKASMKGKPFTRENIERAGYNAREITLDFSKGGVRSKYINQLSAFFNTNIQGVVKVAEILKDTPLKAVAIMGSIGVLNAYLNFDFEKGSLDEEIAEVPNVQRHINYVFKTENEDGESIIWRIPKPQQLGYISTVFEEAFYYLFSGMKKEAREKFVENTAKALYDELNFAPFPNAFLTPFETISNYSTFTGKPIVPAYMEKILPEYQYTDATSETAKSISRLLAALGDEETTISPMKIEYMIRGYTGGFGNALLKTADTAGEKMGIYQEKDRAAKTLADVPFVRSFVVRNPSAGAESIAKFYELADKAEKRFNTAQLELARTNVESYRGKAAWEAYNSVLAIKRVMSEYNGMIRSIDLSKKMNKDEKRQSIDGIYREMIKMAKKGIKAYEKVDGYIKQKEE